MRSAMASARALFGAPHACGQPVVGVVGYGDSFVVMVVGDYREDGTEDLLPGDAHVATDVGDDRRSHPEPVREFINAHCSAAERHGRALRTCAFDVTEDAVALFGVDDRAHISVPIPG